MKILIRLILKIISLLSPVNPSSARVLVYHSIGRVKSSEISDWLVSEDAFEAQIKYLTENKYNIIKISELRDFFKKGIAPPPKTICITFDDGLLDNYEVAAPILNKYHVPASFFIVAGSLMKSETGVADFSRYSKNLMSIYELDQLKKQFHELGSHSLTHRNFSLLSTEQIYSELLDSKLLIEKNLDIECNVFVCPFGITENQLKHEKTKELLAQCGYEIAFLGRFGACKTKSNIYDLPRITIYGWDNIGEFINKIDGGFDWIEYPIIIFKILRHKLINLLEAVKV